ncbi:MAG: hypothetical protein Q7S74_05365 [Nanoarchaeota archaeon]|nr:hypothetical protein [Nanoarchaeota archaeon]
MEQDDFGMNILIGIISGLIVALAVIVSDCIDKGCNPQTTALKIGILIAISIILFIIFIKTFNHLMKKQEADYKKAEDEYLRKKISKR